VHQVAYKAAGHFLCSAYNQQKHGETEMTASQKKVDDSYENRLIFNFSLLEDA
jgi:hypothetical protein